jgi:hypothetical protein
MMLIARPSKRDTDRRTSHQDAFFLPSDMPDGIIGGQNHQSHGHKPHGPFPILVCVFANPIIQ